MNTRQRLIAALSLCAMVCFPAQGQPPDRVQFGVLGNVPFTIQEQGKPASGLYVELIATIIEHSGIDAATEILPLARVVSQLKAGTTTAALAVPSPDLLEIAVPVAEVGQLDGVVIGPKGTRIGAYDELLGKNVCVMRGASFAPRLHDDPRITKTVVSESGACLRMLRVGRVDFVAATLLGVWWHVRSGTIDRSELGEPFVLSRRPIVLLVSKQAARPALLKSLAEGVRLAKGDGSINRIVGRYAGP